MTQVSKKKEQLKSLDTHQEDPRGRSDPPRGGSFSLVYVTGDKDRALAVITGNGHTFSKLCLYLLTEDSGDSGKVLMDITEPQREGEYKKTEH